MILDLEDPPEPAPEEPGRPQLRLVPRGPRVVFRRPEDPEVPWTIRALGYALGLIITGLAVGLILLVASLLKQVYETVDAQDRARAAARAAQEQKPGGKAGVKAPEGAILLTLPDGKAPPPSPPPQPAPAEAHPKSP